MMDEGQATRLGSSMLTLRRRSNLAVIALSGVIAARVADLVTREWTLHLLGKLPHTDAGARADLMEQLQSADAMVGAGNTAVTFTFLVSAFSFLWWTHRFVRTSNELGLKYFVNPGQAVWSFIIPIVCLHRPYQLFNSAHAALEPDRVALPPPRVDPAAQNDYRGVAFIETAAVGKLPKALIGMWWGAFIVMGIGSRLLTMVSIKAKTVAEVTQAYHGNMFLSGVALVGAALAITVVRGMTARVGERFRRIRASTPEELAAQGIEL